MQETVPYHKLLIVNDITVLENSKSSFEQNV
jgi:hypothetical protein